jgi:hypothetical protein
MIQGDSIDTKPVVKNEVGACWYKNCQRCFLNVLVGAGYPGYPPPGYGGYPGYGDGLMDLMACRSFSYSRSPSNASEEGTIHRHHLTTMLPMATHLRDIPTVDIHRCRHQGWEGQGP